jgi:hypothetical protein
MTKLNKFLAAGAVLAVLVPVVIERTRAIPQDVWTGVVSQPAEMTQEQRDKEMRDKFATPAPATAATQTPAGKATAVAVFANYLNNCGALNNNAVGALERLKAERAYSNDELGNAVASVTSHYFKMGAKTWCNNAADLGSK